MLVLCAMVFMRVRWVRLNLFLGLFMLLQTAILVTTVVVSSCGLGVAVSICTAIFILLLVHKDDLVIFEVPATIGGMGPALFCGYFWQAIRNLNMNSKLHRGMLMANMVVLVNGLVESVNNKLAV